MATDKIVRGRRSQRRTTRPGSAKRPFRYSYLKAPYYKPIGPEHGVYRVGPLGRLNVADACGTPKADAEKVEFHQRFGNPAHSSFLFHYARLIELLHSLERIAALAADPKILDRHVRGKCRA